MDKSSNILKITQNDVLDRLDTLLDDMTRKMVHKSIKRSKRPRTHIIDKNKDQ